MLTLLAPNTLQLYVCHVHRLKACPFLVCILIQMTIATKVISGSETSQRKKFNKFQPPPVLSNVFKYKVISERGWISARFIKKGLFSYVISSFFFLEISILDWVYHEAQFHQESLK